MTQCEMILDYIQRNGSITPAEAIDQLGCYRLGARIYDLKARGHDIRCTMTESVNRFGKTVRFAKYWLRFYENEGETI